MFGLSKLRLLWMVMAATTCLVPPCFGQSVIPAPKPKIHLGSAIDPAICSAPSEKGVKAALSLVCLQDHSRIRDTVVEKAIIIGFVGGFVQRDDMKHPEVRFAAHLRASYPSKVHVEVFANHDGKRALHRVLQLLSEDEDGVLPSRESEKARII